MRRMGRTRIKICGVRTPEALDAACDHGADAVGFVFHPQSPRYIDPPEAFRLAGRLPPFVAGVGLTVNLSVEDFCDLEEVCPCDYWQLHGEESEETVRRCGPRVIRAVRFDPATIDAALRTWDAVDEVDALLIDGSAGGEGTALDWRALAAALDRVETRCPVILAGGLTPDNVGEAVRTVRPWGVDVSSGVERERGVKDAALIGAFCRAVRRADGDS